MAKTLKRLALVFAFVLPLACGVALTACNKTDKETTYKVTYVDGVDDEELEVPVDTNEYKKGDKATIKEGITREDYAFTGWLYTGNIVYQPGDQLTMPAKNVTLTAQWAAVTNYTVTYDLDGGTYKGSSEAPTESKKLEGETFTVADAAEKVNCVFGGWNDGTKTYQPGETYTVGTSNVTLKAVWNQKYTVTFSMGEWEDFEGELPEEDAHVEGDTFMLPQAPEREDYEFLRWEDEDGNDYQPGTTFVMPAKNVTITAIWAEAGKTHLVSYEMGEYEGTFAHGGKYVEGEQVTLPEPPEFEDYDFVKWTVDGEDYQPGDTFEMPDHDVTVTAVWNKIIYYTVTFDLGDYEGTVEGGSYRANAKFNLPEALVQSGYTFYGWTTVARNKVTWDDLLEANAEYTMPAKDVTIYAIGQKTPVLGVGADDTEHGIVNVASDIIIDNEDAPTVINLKDGVAGGDYTIRISASSLLNAAGSGYISFTVVIDGEEITITSTSTAAEKIIEIPAGVTYIEIYGSEHLMHATVKLTAEYILRPERSTNITLASGESKTYTISFTYDEYGMYLWLKLEFSEEAQGVTATFNGTDVSEGQAFFASYNQKVVFTGKLDVTFTVTLAITTEPKEEADNTLEVGGTIENIASIDDKNNNYYVLIDLVGTTPGKMYELTFRTTAAVWRKFYLDTDSGSELGETAGWGGTYNEEDAVITFMMPDDTTTIKLRTFGNNQDYVLAFVTLTESAQLDFEIKDKLESGAAVRVNHYFGWVDIPLADSVGAGDYIVTIYNPDGESPYYIALDGESYSDETPFGSDYTVQITIADEKTIWLNGPYQEGIIVKLDKVITALEVDGTYTVEVGGWTAPGEIPLDASVTPGTYVLTAVDPIAYAQYKVSLVNPVDDINDPTMYSANGYSIIIEVTEGTDTIYLYAFGNIGTKLTVKLTAALKADTPYKTTAGEWNKPTAIALDSSVTPGIYTLSVAGGSDQYRISLVDPVDDIKDPMVTTSSPLDITITDKVTHLYLYTFGSHDTVITLTLTFKSGLSTDVEYWDDPDLEVGKEDDFINFDGSFEIKVNLEAGKKYKLTFTVDGVQKVSDVWMSLNGNNLSGSASGNTMTAEFTCDKAGKNTISFSDMSFNQSTKEKTFTIKIEEVA